MNRSDALAAMAGSRVAHLATTTPRGDPHVVAVTFAMTREAVVTMIDHKPKTTSRLQRVINLERHPRASILVDHYVEDWTSLWWVRVDGPVELETEGVSWEASKRALADKYRQYRERPPQGTAIVIAIDRVTWWASTP